MNQELGRSLIVFGAGIVLIGVLLLFAGKIPFVGRLPGDVVVRAGELGFDMKWKPNARHTLDLTVRPDFSQVESDVAQISTNQRFALFYPEKRPFFLEGADRFSSLIDVVYTRSINNPIAAGKFTKPWGKERVSEEVTA